CSGPDSGRNTLQGVPGPVTGPLRVQACAGGPRRQPRGPPTRPRLLAPREEEPMFEDIDLVHRYSRSDPLHDGVRIDVPPTAREAGFRYPVALTAAVWALCVEVPPGVAYQDEAGPLWDVLFMLRWAVGRSSGPEVRFALHVRNDNRERTPP